LPVPANNFLSRAQANILPDFIALGKSQNAVFTLDFTILLPITDGR